MYALEHRHCTISRGIPFTNEYEHGVEESIAFGNGTPFFCIFVSCGLPHLFVQVSYADGQCTNIMQRIPMHIDVEGAVSLRFTKPKVDSRDNWEP